MIAKLLRSASEEVSVIQPLKTIYNLILDPFKVKVCWTRGAAILFVKMRLSSSSWFDSACHFKSMWVVLFWMYYEYCHSRCHLYYFVALWICCSLSPDFKCVWMRVKVCVLLHQCFFFYQLVTCLDVFSFFQNFLWESCQRFSHLSFFAKRLWQYRLMCVAHCILCCVNLSQRQIMYGFHVLMKS